MAGRPTIAPIAACAEDGLHGIAENFHASLRKGILSVIDLEVNDSLVP